MVLGRTKLVQIQVKGERKIFSVTVKSMQRSITKKLTYGLATSISKALEMFGINAKELYEYAYWKYRKLNEKELSNSHYQKLFTEWVGFELSFYDGKRILDIGCGPRGSLEWADNSLKRVGLDPLVNSYRKLGIDNHKMEYVHASVEKIPFPDEFFDIVTSFNSLDHITNLQEAAAEISRVLRASGVFVVVVEIHKRPTIAEPITLSWKFLTEFERQLEIIHRENLKYNPDFGGSNAALQTRIPLETPIDGIDEGVVFAILRKKMQLALYPSN
jgi:ubiquinone/menaquinone biosynthesis C-methylase UbiE